jgi:hypothetical protein
MILQSSNLGGTQLLGFLLVFFLLLLHCYDQPTGSLSETPDLLMDMFPECIFGKKLALQSGHAQLLRFHRLVPLGCDIFLEESLGFRQVPTGVAHATCWIHIERVQHHVALKGSIIRSSAALLELQQVMELV